MPRSRHHSTTLRRWSTPSTRPLGLDGEFSHSSAGTCGPERGERVGRHRRRAAQRRTDLVGRVGQLGVDDQVTRAEAEVAGQRGDQLLGADQRQDLVQTETGDPVPALEPVDRRLPRRGPPDGDRVARGVRGVAQRLLRDLRGRVHRGADREVDDPVGVLTRPLRMGREVVPGEVGQQAGDAGARQARAPFWSREGDQWSWACGGSAATIGWSLSISPILAAPPGEPRSSKNCDVGVVEALLLLRDVVLVEDRLDRADRLARAAVHALVGVDVEHPLALVDAVDRALVDARAVLQVDTRLGDDVRHRILLRGRARRARTSGRMVESLVSRRARSSGTPRCEQKCRTIRLVPRTRGGRAAPARPARGRPASRRTTPAARRDRALRRPGDDRPAGRVHRLGRPLVHRRPRGR